MPVQSQPGFFITFEGSEGCGKSTQIRMLENELRQRGFDPLLVREPGGTEIGDQIRHLLQHAPEGRAMTPETELLLFAASRAQLTRQVIAPALAAGRLVISDRFMDSTTVYQGVARNISAATVAEINRFAVGLCVPNLTFLFDMDSGEALRRAQQRPGGRPADRMESEPAAFYEAVRQGYLALARTEERFRVINADETELAVHDNIIRLLTSHAFLQRSGF